MLKDPDKPLDLERAKAISGVAQTIINTAKVEVHQHGQGGSRAYQGDRREHGQRVLRGQGAAPESGRSSADGAAEDFLIVVLEGLVLYRAFVCRRAEEIKHLLEETRCERKDAQRPLLLLQQCA